MLHVGMWVKSASYSAQCCDKCNVRFVSAWPVTANVLADSDACTLGLLKWITEPSPFIMFTCAASHRHLRRLNYICLVHHQGQWRINTGHAKAAICKQIWDGPRMYIPIGMGSFHGFTVYRTPKFSWYQNCQGHGILQYSLLMPYYKWSKYLHCVQPYFFTVKILIGQNFENCPSLLCYHWLVANWHAHMFGLFARPVFNYSILCWPWCITGLTLNYDNRPDHWHQYICCTQTLLRQYDVNLDKLK